jgi:GGDEF domain-containing protein
MLSKIEMYEELAGIILHHHERYDGKGYPDNLKGDEIPILSQIMSVSDAFDAMTTNRIYKARKEISEALDEIQLLSGSQFHPDAVKAAVKVLTSVHVPIVINQLPVNNLEKKRFSYFFNDKLTGLYNEDYLTTTLNNLDLNKYTCLQMLHLLHVADFNKLHGWAKGNTFFKEFAIELQHRFPESLIFRAYGNDFAIISKEHLAIDKEVFNAFQCIINTAIEIEIEHIDLSARKSYTIDKMEKLEIQSIDVLQPIIKDYKTKKIP